MDQERRREKTQRRPKVGSPWVASGAAASPDEEMMMMKVAHAA